ncbi:MAG TPA: hypothetical protein VGZ00_06530 [Candidatus Baltobacteraceae bacterium]|jgi:hypothetical protein|nr:hypothetical protein [Candidatus Baltobacteraceae bacterium]
MGNPYFHEATWATFVHLGATYSLAHLNEYTFSVVDTDGKERKIVVNFSDHCFTRDVKSTDHPQLFYPRSTRKPVGVFCFERYEYSLGLIGHIAHASTGKVWNAGADVFAIVPLISRTGKEMLYAIVFSLERVKGLPVDLRMRIKTAYPCDEKPIETFGEVRFRHLVALRMRGKSPGRITGRHRKKPHVPSEGPEKK